MASHKRGAPGAPFHPYSISLKCFLLLYTRILSYAAFARLLMRANPLLRRHKFAPWEPVIKAETNELRSASGPGCVKTSLML